MITAHTVLIILHLLSRISIPSVVFIFTIILSPQSVYLPFLFKVFPPFLQHSFSDWFPDITKEGETRRWHKIKAVIQSCFLFYSISIGDYKGSPWEIIMSTIAVLDFIPFWQFNFICFPSQRSQIIFSTSMYFLMTF